MLEFQALLPEVAHSRAHRAVDVVTPQLVARRPYRSSSKSQPSVTPVQEVTETALPILIEDLAPLYPILSSLGLIAAYHLEHEPGMRLLQRSTATYSWADADDVRILDPAVSLLRPDGQRHATLGILTASELQHECLRLVLENSLLLAERTIAERWFRLQHRKRWIVAAAPIKNPDIGLLLAIDHQMQLQALDTQAARSLQSKASGSPPRWQDFFRPITPWPSSRVRADIPLRLFGTSHDEPWMAILTAPDCSASSNSHDALLHARPRLHGLVDLTTGEAATHSRLPSLTPGMRRKIEEFVEAHLDMPLSVERLAQTAGMSCSWFTRAFRDALKMTPHRYVMWRRLLRAQELIKNSDTSITEIALATGFSDQSHLCRLFQLNMGETPSRFRRLCR
jgi:AraC-like DNA-binding protein